MAIFNSYVKLPEGNNSQLRELGDQLKLHQDFHPISISTTMIPIIPRCQQNPTIFVRGDKGSIVGGPRVWLCPHRWCRIRSNPKLPLLFSQHSDHSVHFENVHLWIKTWSIFGSPEFLKSYFAVHGYFPFVFIATKAVTRGLNHYVYSNHIRIIFPLNHYDTNYSILFHIITGIYPYGIIYYYIRGIFHYIKIIYGGIIWVYFPIYHNHSGLSLRLWYPLAYGLNHYGNGIIPYFNIVLVV